MLRFPGGTGEQFQSIRGGETLSTNRYRSQPSPYPTPFRRRLPPSMQLPRPRVRPLSTSRHSPGKCTNALGDKERQTFGSLSALTMLQSIRSDLFGYDLHLEVWQLWRSQPPRDASSRPASSARPWATIGSRHGTRGTTRSMLRSRSALEKCSASTESDGVSVMRMHLKAGQLLLAATLRTGTRTLASG
jgi:hypothetical protein